MRQSTEVIRPLILAMDTSGDVCSVATLRADALISEHTFRHGMHLSEHLMAHVDAVLVDAGATIEEVDTFAVGIGPGSFTGTRIGVMAMKTLAALFEKPLVGISGLDALAYPYCGLPSTLIVPLLPCRAGVTFTCLFTVEESIPRALTEPAAVPITELQALLEGRGCDRILCCGPSLTLSTALIQAALNGLGIPVSFGNAAFPRAADLGRIALARVASGTVMDDPLSLVPLYVSPPPITIPKTSFTEVRTP